MGLAGRPKKPASLKLITGNPGSRPVSLPDFQPVAELPECPDHLVDRARAEWERIGPLLVGYGLMSRVDLAALALYCQSYGRWQALESELADAMAEDGRMTVSTPNGHTAMHPLVYAINAAMAQTNTYLQAFGLSPQTREKVTASAQRGLFDTLDKSPEPDGSSYVR